MSDLLNKILATAKPFKSNALDDVLTFNFEVACGPALSRMMQGVVSPDDDAKKLEQFACLNLPYNCFAAFIYIFKYMPEGSQETKEALERLKTILKGVFIASETEFENLKMQGLEYLGDTPARRDLFEEAVKELEVFIWQENRGYQNPLPPDRS